MGIDYVEYSRLLDKVNMIADKSDSIIPDSKGDKLVRLSIKMSMLLRNGTNKEKQSVINEAKNLIGEN